MVFFRISMINVGDLVKRRYSKTDSLFEHYTDLHGTVGLVLEHIYTEPCEQPKSRVYWPKSMMTEIISDYQLTIISKETRYNV